MRQADNTPKTTKPVQQRTARTGTAPQQRGRTLAPRRRRWPWLLAALTAVLVIGGVTLSQLNSVVGEIEGVQSFPNLPQGHQDGTLTYDQTPPVGGVHNAVWQNCGVYEQPVANENAVHSLEHGAVWVTYRPDLPAEQVEQLQTLLRGRGYTLLSPYPDLPAPVVASAWGYQLQLQSANDERLEQFLGKYIQGAQTPEPGAACIGGTSAPAGSN
jgi:hypothetical protein